MVRCWCANMTQSVYHTTAPIHHVLMTLLRLGCFCCSIFDYWLGVTDSKLFALSYLLGSWVNIQPRVHRKLFKKSTFPHIVQGLLVGSGFVLSEEGETCSKLPCFHEMGFCFQIWGCQMHHRFGHVESSFPYIYFIYTHI